MAQAKLDIFASPRLAALFSAILSCMLSCLTSCAADPDLATAPGVCKLNCAKAKIPSNDMRIRFLSSDPQALFTQCLTAGSSEPENYPNEIPIRFVVEKPRRILPAEQTTASNEVIGGSGPQESEVPLHSAWVPVSGVSFQPSLLAGSMKERNDLNPELDQYKGILTSEGEWCTDTCGVGSINIKPLCIPGQTNNVLLGISAGSLFGAFTVQVVHVGGTRDTSQVPTDTAAAKIAADKAAAEAKAAADKTNDGTVTP